MAALFIFITFQGRRFMKEGGMLKPALIGGLFLGVLTSLVSYMPFAGLFQCCCCLWVIGGGTLAAYVLVRESKSIVKLGQGVILGLISGAIGTVVYFVFSIPRLLSTKVGMAAQFRLALDQMQNIPAENRKMFAALLEKEGMIAFLIAIGFIAMLVAYCFLAMLGGLIGVAIFEKRTPTLESLNPTNFEPPANPPPPPPPPTDDERL
jgi:hypothetical protein